MGQVYRHLTREDRIVIYTLLQQKLSILEIAKNLNRNKSTIYREVKRNAGKRGYRYKQADKKAKKRRSLPRNIKLTAEVINYIEDKLTKEHSPEQISGCIATDINCKLSHETIYKYIWQNKSKGGNLYANLRIANGKKNRKRYGKNDYRGQIPCRKGIEERPSIVESKSRIGDWEGDLISGANHKGFIVTLVERKSKYVVIGKVMKKTSREVSDKIIEMTQKINNKVKTITYDNGREFSNHQEINKIISCESFFARPYHSWERGLSENTNGLIRQYFPKGMNFRNITEKELEFVQNRLNSRPRKTLDFRSPNMVFFGTS